MDEDEPGAGLKALGERLDRARAARPTARSVRAESEASQNALAQGLRIGLELLASVAVSSAIGWAFDTWLGTKPAGIVVGFFLGIGIGMWNVYRAVTGMGMAVGMKRWNEGKNSWDDED
jgi:ATP synthase protein I